MDFLVPLLIGIIVGAGGAWLFYDKKINPKYQAAIDGQTNCAAKLASVYEMLDAAHRSIWGPIGLADQIKIDLFNRIWKWAGLEERGVPTL